MTMQFSYAVCRISIKEILVEIQNQHMNKIAYEWDNPGACFWRQEEMPD